MGHPWLGRNDLSNTQGCPKQLAELLQGRRLPARTTMRTALFENAEETGFGSIPFRSRQANSIQTCVLMEKRRSGAAHSTWKRGPQSAIGPPVSRPMVEAQILP